MKNHKYLCLICLKSAKSKYSCCEFPTYSIGYKARVPKLKAPKHEWKKFFDLFVNSSHDINQLKRIISLRKQYNLSTTEQENKIKILEMVPEEEDERFLDIRAEDRLVEINTYFSSDKQLNTVEGQLVKKIDTVIQFFKKHHAVSLEDVKPNKEYYVVPYHARNTYTYFFPSKAGKFEILKVRSRKPKSDSPVCELYLKTPNTNEIVNWVNFKSNRYYAETQEFLVFESKLKAIAFRQEYLTSIFPILKEAGATYLEDIVDKVKIDYDRIVKKAPELLI